MRELNFDEIDMVTGGTVPVAAQVVAGAIAGGGANIVTDNWTWGSVVANASGGAAIAFLAATGGPVGLAIGVFGGIAIAWAQNHSAQNHSNNQNSLSNSLSNLNSIYIDAHQLDEMHI